MLPLLSFRSLGRFLDLRAARLARRYPSDPGRHEMLRRNIRLSAVVRGSEHLVPLQMLCRKDAAGMAKVTAKGAAKQGKTAKIGASGHVVGRFPKLGCILMGNIA
jgi:hypothetical protein